LAIAEEFGEWEDSKRRIDLLALDKDAKKEASKIILTFHKLGGILRNNQRLF
jgi:hypothetical protein